MKSFKVSVFTVLLFSSFCVRAIDINEGVRTMMPRLVFCPVSDSDESGGVITLNTKERYRLKDDVSYPIVLDADGIVLDLNGYQVTSNNTSDDIITVNTNKKDISVFNGSIKNFAGVGTGSGVLVESGVSNIYLNNLKIFTCGNGVKCDGVDGSEIVFCELVSLDLVSNTTGLYFKYADSNVVEDCIASGCTEVGFALEHSENNRIENCKAFKTFGPNSVAGFRSEDGYSNLFQKCVVKKTETSAWEFCNKAHGILLTGTEEKTKIIDCIINEIDMTSTVSAVAYGIELLPEILQDSDLLVQLATADHGDDSVQDAAWSPDGMYLAIAGSKADPGDDKEVRVFRFDGSTLTQVATAGHDGATILAGAFTISWSPDGKYIAVGGDTATTDSREIRVFRFDGSLLTEIATADHGTATLQLAFSVAWSPNGKYLAAGGNTGTDGKELRIFGFDGSSLTEVATAVHGSTLFSAVWSPDGKYVVVGGTAGTSGKEIRLFSFDGSSLIEVASSDHDATVYSAMWSTNGKFLAIGGASGTDNKEIRVFSFDGSSLIQIASTDHGDSSVRSVVWSSDGKYLAISGDSASDNKEVRIFSFDGSSLSFVKSADHGDSTARSIVWSPGGRYLAVVGDTASDSKEIRVFSAMNGPINCIVDNNSVCDTASYGQFVGTGIAGGGANTFLRNACCNNEVNFTFGVPNVFYGDHNTQRPMDNISMPTI